MGSNSKNELLGIHEDKKVLHNKGSSRQNQKKTQGMGEGKRTYHTQHPKRQIILSRTGQKT